MSDQIKSPTQPGIMIQQSQEDMDTVAMIVGLKMASEQSRLTQLTNHQRWYDTWNSRYTYGMSPDTRSKVFMREAFKAVDTLHSVYMGTLFMSGDPFRVEGITEQIDEIQCGTLQKLLKIYIEKKMGLFVSFSDFVTEMLILGTAFGKLTWDKKVTKKKQKKVTQTLNEDGTTTETTKEVEVDCVRYDAPRFEHISWKDIFLSSRATSLEDTWVIHRSYVPISELEARDLAYFEVTGEHLYKNLKELKDRNISILVPANDRAAMITRSEKSAQGINLSQNMATVKDPVEPSDITESIPLARSSEGDIELMEYWSYDGSSYKIIAGQQVLIYSGENPYEHGKKPFLYANFIRRPKEVWGIGVMELSQDAMDLLNTVVNQQVDSNTLANNLMFAVASDCGFNPEHAVARPGGYIPIDIEEGQTIQGKIQQMTFQRIDTSREIALAINEVQETTGATRMLQGTYESGAVRNTGQAKLIMSAGQSKLKSKVLNFEEMFVLPFIDMIYQLIGQFSTEEMIIKYTGDKGTEYIKINPGDLKLNLEFIPVGTRRLSELQDLLHQMNNFLTIAAGLPNAIEDVNFNYLLKKIWSVISSDHDTSQVLLTDQQKKQKLAEQLAKQQINQSLGGQPGEPAPQGSTASVTPNPGQPNIAGGVQ